MALLFGFAIFFSKRPNHHHPNHQHNPVCRHANAQSPITAPTGAQVLYGTALSPITNQPVRHLWVGDATAGLCRMDPDLDSPGPYAINPATCLAGFAIDGGAMALIR